MREFSVLQILTGKCPFSFHLRLRLFLSTEGRWPLLLKVDDFFGYSIITM